MKRSKILAFAACAAFLGLPGAGYATDVYWKGVTYHNASITSVDGDHVMIDGTSDASGEVSTFRMPLSDVPDDVIQAYRTTHNPAGRATADRPLTPKEEAGMKQERADRRAKLANLKEALARDPYHPVIVAGHVLLKNDEGVVITCDSATPADLPQSAGIVFLRDCPGAQKLKAGDPMAAIGYTAGDHLYNFQKIQAYSIRPTAQMSPTPPPSTGSTPASSP